MILSRKYLMLAFFTIVFYAFMLNEFNRIVIVKHNPLNIESNCRSLVQNNTVFSVDNEWYLPQIKNFIYGKGFTSNPDRAYYDVRRTPVYPLFYGIHYLIFGEAKSFYFIRITQILLFALATIALFFATYHFTQNKKISIISAALFGFNPTLVSYLYFTITEALSPALVCFLLYFLSRCYLYNSKKEWFVTGLFFATGSLCRPSVFFFIIALFYAIVFINRKSIKAILNSSLFVLLGSGILFVPHIIRNYKLTKGDFILLEKYYGDPMNLGKPNIELRHWISCWTNPSDYSSEVISFKMMNTILKDTSALTKKRFIEEKMIELPERATLANKPDDIKAAYESLYEYYIAKFNHPDSAILNLTELNCLSKMAKLKTEFVENKPVQYYAITPLLFLKSVMFQSNASTLAMLDKYETSLSKKMAKSLLYLLNIFLFVSLIGNLFHLQKYFMINGICLLFAFTNFIYIIYVLQYFEVRYLVPVFPVMYISGAVFFTETYERIKRRLNL
jgi:hypothetical protein